MKSAESRRFRNGSYSTLLTVIVVAVLIIVNFIVGGLPTTITKLDLSEQKTLDLSKQTTELVRGLSEDVTVYLVAQQGTEDNITLELIEKYASLSSKVHVVKKDSALDPTFTTKYTSGTLADNSLIVESAKRFKVIPYADIYKQTTSYNESYQQVISTDFDGESQLTNAIDFVTTETLPVAYTVTGHSELAIPDGLVADITGQNIEVKSLNLVQERKIPDDCNALVFYAPAKDITEAEAQVVKEYFENGGSIFLVTTIQSGDTPNLDKLLADYGITVADGLAMEEDTAYTYTDAPYILFAQVKEHAITQPLLDGNINVLVSFGQAISFETADTSLTGTELISTTGKGYIKDTNSSTADVKKSENDVSGKLTLGLAVEKKLEGDKSGKLVLYTTPTMFDEDINNYSAGGNYDLMLNSFGWMCEHESAISIHAKSMDGTQLQVSSAQANLWSTLVVAVIPVALIVIGIVIWIVRRKR